MTGRIELVPHTWGGDKIAKAATAVGIAQSGNLFLPSKAPWLNDFRGELSQFPSGKHDDQVDALGVVCHHVLRFLPNTVRPELPARKNMAVITGDDLDRIERESRRSREVKRRR